MTKNLVLKAHQRDNLEEMLENLVKMKYLRKEHPKKKVGNHREQDETLPIGYNIVAGKMSFEVGKVLEIGEEIRVACGKGIISLLTVVPEGKGKMSAGDFVRGRKIAVGDILH